MTPCIHFGICGGCAHQDLPADAYRAMKRDLVVQALARHGLVEAAVEDIVEVPLNSRRRATFKTQKRGNEVLIGFHAARSHEIVDMRECKVITPTLFAFTSPLREMMAELLRDGEIADIDVTQTDTGLDVAIHGKRITNLATRAKLALWAERLKLARVSIGKDVVTEFAAPTVRFGKISVKLPADAFLQPTREGEAALRLRVLAGVKGAKTVADLFSGCGTFALPLAEQSRVHAVERDTAMLDALAAGARGAQGLKPVTTETRDLFKLPLTQPELKAFDAVVLDPPRAGAAAQVAEIARARVRRVVYVSCDPMTFARDARVLVDGGYRMSPVTPVDQFLWSSHIELVAVFAVARGM